MTESIRDEPKGRNDELADTFTTISVLAKMLASLLRCGTNDNEDERDSQDEQDE